MTTREILWNTWNWNLFAVVLCAAVVAISLWLARFQVQKRYVAFLLGVLLLLVSFSSPVSFLAGKYLFAAHMVEHLVLFLVVPALLVTGCPSRLILRVLGSETLEQVERVISRPYVAWSIGIVIVAALQIPMVFDAGATDPPFEIAQHLLLAFGGVIFWWPVLAPLPEMRLNAVPQSMIYLLAACMVYMLMGILVTFAPPYLYTAYVYANPDPGILRLVRDVWHVSAEQDQQLGGIILWIGGFLILSFVAVFQLLRWYAAMHAEEMESIHTSR